MTATEESLFDFDRWINENNLNDIKSILIKHDLNIKANLSTQSKQFTSFICDPALFETNIHLMPNAVAAIQKLSSTETPGNNETPGKPFVVISEKEENILQSLQTNLDELTEKDKLTKSLNKKYEQSINDMNTRKTSKINTTKNKILSYFEKTINEISVKKQELLQELNTFNKENVIQDISEQKESQIISESKILIKEAKHHLSQTLSECNHIIQASMNMDRDERKKKIININNEAIMQYIQMKNTLESNIAMIKDAIKQNNSVTFDIDFERNTGDIQRAMRKLQSVKLATSKQDEGDETKDMELDDDIIKKQEIMISQQMEEIKTLNAAINILQSDKGEQLSNVERMRYERMISEQEAQIKSYQYEMKQQRDKYARMISVKVHENEELERKYVAAQNRNIVLENKLNVLQNEDNEQKEQLSIKIFPFKGDSNKERYLSCAKCNDFSCLMNYSAKYSMKKPKFSFKRLNGRGDQWKATLNFGGVTISKEGVNKKDARIKCITEFIDQYV